MQPRLHTRATLRADLESLGISAGDMVMVHAAVSKVGPLIDGPDTLIGALRDAVGPQGTVLAYTDWQTRYTELLDADGRVPEIWRKHVIPFDPAASRASRDHGVFAEFLRTTPGARRSGNPGASVAAIGERAEWVTDPHPLDYGYGADSPFGRLAEAGGKVAMIGAPHDTMTLLHHAEQMARIPEKRVWRYEAPLAGPTGTNWRMIEEFDTRVPVTERLADDYFAAIVEQFLAGGKGRNGKVGDAPSTVVDADAAVAFAIAWLEARFA